MCLRRAPEMYIAGAGLDKAALDHPVFTSLDFVTIHFLEASHPILKVEDPVFMSPGTEIPFHLLLQPTGLLWKYSNRLHAIDQFCMDHFKALSPCKLCGADL
jgi:hypothetical protein